MFTIEQAAETLFGRNQQTLGVDRFSRAPLLLTAFTVLRIEGVDFQRATLNAPGVIALVEFAVHIGIDITTGTVLANLLKAGFLAHLTLKGLVDHDIAAAGVDRLTGAGLKADIHIGDPALCIDIGVVADAACLSTQQFGDLYLSHAAGFTAGIHLGGQLWRKLVHQIGQAGIVDADAAQAIGLQRLGTDLVHGLLRLLTLESNDMVALNPGLDAHAGSDEGEVDITQTAVLRYLDHAPEWRAAQQRQQWLRVGSGDAEQEVVVFGERLARAQLQVIQ